MGRSRQRLVQAGCVLLALSSASCVGDPDGTNIPADMALYAYQNEPVSPFDRGFKAGAGGAAIASSDIPWRIPSTCRRDYRSWLSQQEQPVGRQDDWLRTGRCSEPPKDALVAVAITGGGNKSAVYATEVLFELERYGLAQHIDVVSSVSGGSFTAMLYALSCDKADAGCTSLPGWKRPVWDYEQISRRVEVNYLIPFLARRMMPSQMFLNATTHHGSADDLADILRGRLLQENGRPLVFSDLNPQRPNLILNATNVTQQREALDQDAGIPFEAKRPLSDDDALHFSFTQQYFWRLLSRLDTYPLADAVVASAAFPLLIDRPSLRLYRPEDLDAIATQKNFRTPQYISLYDGGVHDNFGLVELRWFIECQFDRNARRVPWTPEIRQRMCGSPAMPKRPPSATLILGINSSLLRTAGVSKDKPKPRSWDSYLGPLRLGGAADSVDMIMAASGELRKMELRSLVEEISRAAAGLRTGGDNPFVAPGPHQYVDIDIEAANYLSCPFPVGLAGQYSDVWRGSTHVLNSANGGTERRRCEGLLGVLDWNARRNIQLPVIPSGFCSSADCPELDTVVGDRKLGEADPAKQTDLFIAPGGPAVPQLLHNHLLFEAVREVPTNFELSSHYVHLLRYVARWAVAHRVWELCTDHLDLVALLPGGAGPVCDKPLPNRSPSMLMAAERPP